MKRIVLPLLLWLAWSLSACSFSLAEDITPPPDYRPPTPVQEQPVQVSGPLYPLVPPDPANGAVLYVDECAPCHGNSGDGNGSRSGQLPNPVPNLSDPQVARQAAPSKWYAMITQGNLERFMPLFGNKLSAGQRWDVLAYVYSLSAPADRLAQANLNYAQKCASCHGKTGRGDGEQATGLFKRPANFTDQAFMAGKTAAHLYAAITDGITPVMPSFQGQLTDDERWALSEFVRSLSFAGPQPALTPQASTGDIASGESIAATPALPITSTGVLSPVVISGLIAGQIINTSGGELPANLEVTLHGFEAMQLVLSDTTTIQAGGFYSFTQVDLPTGRAFLVSTQYGGTTYSSDVAVVEVDTNKVSLDILVYDTTTDTASLSVDRMHVFLDFSNPGLVQIVELYIVSNLGNKTVVASQEGGSVLEFALPTAATNLQFDSGALGQRYVEIPGGFGDILPIQPGQGEYQVLFAYDMPYDRKLDLQHPVNLPINALVILLPEDGVKIKGETLQDSGTRDVQGVAYHMYNGGRLEAGQSFSLTITGRPGSSQSFLSSPDSRSSLVIGLGALGLVLVTAALFLYRRSRGMEGAARQQPVVEQSGVEESDPDSLMDAIVALDDLHQDGKLPDEAYRQRRAELKEQLRRALGNRNQ